MAAQSLLLPSLSPKIPTNPSSPKTLTLVFSSLSLSKPASLSLTSSSFLSFPLVRNARNISSGMVRRVAMSPDIEEEEEEELSGGEEASFSADLKLFVGNLPFNVDSAELADLFERAGAVEMVEVIYDKLTGKSRGFGFVTMSTVEEVEAAAQQFNGYELSGRILRVNSGPPPRKDEFQSKGFRTGSSFDNPNRGFRTGSSFDNPNRGFRTGSSFDSPNRGFRTGSSIDSTNRVYVGNLSWGVDNLALETLFSEQGKVMEAKVVYDRESGRSRGFGFVTYGSAKEVNDAISSLDGVVSVFAGLGWEENPSYSGRRKAKAPVLIIPLFSCNPLADFAKLCICNNFHSLLGRATMPQLGCVWWG